VGEFPDDDNPPVNPDDTQSPSGETPTTEPFPAEIFFAGLWEHTQAFDETFTLTVAGMELSGLEIDYLGLLPSLTSCEYSATEADGAVTAEFTVTYAPGYKLAAAYLNEPLILKLSDRELQTYGQAVSVLGEVILPDMTDYEKELAIHDYIVDNCVYDLDNLAAGTVSDDMREPYGVLVRKVAICSGYSTTFKMFMDMLGIECDIISGIGNGAEYGGDHAWNRVKLGDDYYLVDVTWDDPVGTNNDGRAVSHTYFNVTDEVMARDHTPDKPYSPSAFATEFNYFYYNKLVIGSQAEFDAAVAAAHEKGLPEVTLLCVGVNAAELDREAVFSYVKSFSYSIDDSVNTITIIF
jgi:hypothetical protein